MGEVERLSEELREANEREESLKKELHEQRSEDIGTERTEESLQEGTGSLHHSESQDANGESGAASQSQSDRSHSAEIDAENKIEYEATGSSSHVRSQDRRSSDKQADESPTLHTHSDHHSLSDSATRSKSHERRERIDKLRDKEDALEEEESLSRASSKAIHGSRSGGSKGRGSQRSGQQGEGLEHSSRRHEEHSSAEQEVEKLSEELREANEREESLKKELHEQGSEDIGTERTEESLQEGTGSLHHSESQDTNGESGAA